MSQNQSESESERAQRDAIDMARSGALSARLRVGLRALRRLLRDPDRTEEAFLIGIALNAGSFPRLIAQVVTDDAGFALCKEQPRIDSQHVDFDRLRRLGADTLGGAYVRYLDDNKLDPDLFQPPPGLPEVPRWIATRIRQTHDIWHALSGYGPDVVGELALQAFTFGQLRMPSAWAIATLGTLVRARPAARFVWEGFRRGRDAAFLPAVRFEDLWDRPLEEVRGLLKIAPMRVKPPKLGRLGGSKLFGDAPDPKASAGSTTSVEQAPPRAGAAMKRRAVGGPEEARA